MVHAPFRLRHLINLSKSSPDWMVVVAFLAIDLSAGCQA